jgi:hypothetical protein
VIEEKEKNQSLISLVQGKEPLDDRSTVENKVIEINLIFKHLTRRHTLINIYGF